MDPRSPVVGILLVVLLGLSFGLGQECYKDCELPVATCNYVNYPVYPIGINFTANEETAHEFISPIASNGVINQQCKDLVSKFVCGVLYHSCENITEFNSTTGVNETVPIKIKPCLSMCTELNSPTGPCGAYINLLPLFLSPEQMQFINCSRTEPDGTPFYDTTNTDCYVLDNLTPVERCTNDTITVPTNCEPYIAEQNPHTSTFCAPFVSSEIYMSMPQSSMDALLYNMSFYLLEEVYRLMPVSCYKSIASVVCQTAYPTCSRSVDPFSGALVESGVAPCIDACEIALNDTCSWFFDLVGSIPDSVNCTLIAALSGGNASQCTMALFPPNASESFVFPDFERCPSVLAKKPNPEGDEIPCWVPCPDPTYSNDEWNKLILIGEASGGIAFCLMIFLLLTTALDAKRRRLHLHMCVYASSALLSFSFFLNGSNPQEDVWCDDAVTYATNSSNAQCGAQAFFFQFAALAVIFWWMVIAYHMYSSVVLRKTPDLKVMEPYYHLCCWGIPLALTIITAGVGGHGYGPPAAWCYIHDPGYADAYDADFKNKGGISLDYYVFYIPLGLCLLATIVMLIIVFRTIYDIFQKAKDIRTDKSGDKAELRLQARILVFVILLMIIFILLFEWRVHLDAIDVNQLKEDDLAWVICKIKEEIGWPNPGDCPGDKLPRRINYQYTSFETFLASSFGIFVFIAFGTDPTIFTFWLKLLRIRTASTLKTFIVNGESEGPTMSTSPSLQNSTASMLQKSKSQNSKTSRTSKTSKSSETSEVELSSRDQATSSSVDGDPTSV